MLGADPAPDSTRSPLTADAGDRSTIHGHLVGAMQGSQRITGNVRAALSRTPCIPTMATPGIATVGEEMSRSQRDPDRALLGHHGHGGRPEPQALRGDQAGLGVYR